MQRIPRLIRDRAFLTRAPRGAGTITNRVAFTGKATAFSAEVSETRRPRRRGATASRKRARIKREF